MIWISPKRRLPLVIALLVGIIVLGTIVAHARGPAPKAGATYTGTVIVQTRSGAIHQQLGVSFRVSADGHRVGALRLPDGVPSSCPATRLRAVKLRPGSVAIVSPSTFRLRVALTDGGRVGTLLMSGAFHTFSRESGALSTTFTGGGLGGCGTGAGYSAKAAL